MTRKWVFWIDELRQGHSGVVGRKCANLGEMTGMGLTVPAGFALSVEAYEDFMSMTGADDEVRECIRDLRTVPGGRGQLDGLSERLRSIIRARAMPREMADAVCWHYDELGRRCGKAQTSVSVRSSGPVSHPGQYETCLNVVGASEVVDRIKQVWASTFNTASLAFRSQKGLPLESDPIGVAVLKMVRASAAGVIFTADPNTGDASRMIIEANWGLGESVVGGRSTPDIFVINKGSLEIEDKVLGSKTRCVIMGQAGVKEVETPRRKRSAFCLSDEEVRTIGKLGRLLEEHFGVPQDVEWAIDQDAELPRSVVLLQTRAAVIARKKTSVDQIVDLMLDRFSGGAGLQKGSF